MDGFAMLAACAAVLLSGGTPPMFTTSVPEVYLIDYAADHVDNPAYLETVAAAPPGILHVGHDVVFKSHLGPCRGFSAFPEMYERLSPAECEAEIARLKGYVDSLHGAGVKTVIPYICDVLVFGDHVKRTGFWEFYDHWDEYESLGLGSKPNADPIEWMQNDEREPLDQREWYVYKPCVNHPDWQRYLGAVVRIVARCGYDGVFVDVNSFRCKHECCRSMFVKYLENRYSKDALKDRFGFDSAESVRLAEETDRSLLGVEMRRFRASSMTDLFTVLRNEGEALRPGFMVLPNLSPMAHIDGVRKRVGNGQDVGRWAASCSWLMFEEMQQSGRFGPDTISDCILPYKLAFASGIRGGMLLYHARDRDGVALAMAEAGAGGGGGLIQPAYECPEVRTQYARFWRENRAIFEGLDPWSEVGVFYFRDELYWHNFKHMRDVYRLRRDLSDEHVLFDFIVEQNVSATTLRRYQAVILPEARHLSDEQVNDLREYVSEGGILVAIGSCGGVTELGRARSPKPFAAQSSAAKPDDKTPIPTAGKGHIVLAHDLDALVPPRPLELFDFTEDEASEIGVVLERTHDVAAGDTGPSVLLSLLRSIAKTELAVVGAETPATIRFSAFVKEEGEKRSLVVHVVNYDVPIHAVAKSGPPVVVRDLDVRIPLPAEWHAASVEALEPGAGPVALPFSEGEQRLCVTVPRVSIYTVLHVRCDRASAS